MVRRRDGRQSTAGRHEQISGVADQRVRVWQNRPLFSDCHDEHAEQRCSVLRQSRLGDRVPPEDIATDER